jgi:hypothetical protein
MKTWKDARCIEMAKPVADRHLAAYDPPKPTQIQGLQTVRAAVHNMNSCVAFQDGLRRTFVTLGQAPDPALLPAYTFQPYPGHEAIKRHEREIMPNACDALCDQLLQIQFEERDEDDEQTSDTQ